MKDLIKLLTMRRMMNSCYVVASFYLSRVLKRPIVPPSPIGISVEPTTSCNLRCPECPSGLRAFSRPTGMLSIDLFRKLIDEISSKTFFLTFYFQGEPFLNPSIYEMIGYARKMKMYVVTSTNAHYLTEENCRKIIDAGLNKLIISVDGSNQQSYEKYRVGGNFEKVLEGVKAMVQAKKDAGHGPLISLQTVIFSTNENELIEIKKLAEDLQVDELKFKTAQVYDFQNGNSLLPKDEALARYEKTADGSYKLKRESEESCWKMWSSCVMTWDGAIVPCCFDKDAKYQLGKIEERTFSEVWKSSPYNSFRSTILKNRSNIDICQNCSEGSKVFV